jgi:hypothetical protein
LDGRGPDDGLLLLEEVFNLEAALEGADR